MSVVKQKVISGTIWESAGQYLSLGIQFVVTIIIARILTPSDFGVVGLLTVFTAISMILLNSGFSQALIQKKDANDVDFSSVFYVNLAVGLVLYFVLYYASYYIAVFYNIPELTKYARITFLIIPISSLGLVQNVIIQKRMEFKKTAFASLCAALISGFVGIWMVYSGHGIMALVIQQVSMFSIRTLMYILQMRWKPKFIFSIRAIKSLFSFSMNLMFHSLINTLFRNIYTLIIGKYFSIAKVGYYNQASKFEQIAASTLTDVVVKVSMPALVQIKDDIDKVRLAYKKITSMTFFIICPLMILLICIAEPLFVLLLTEKWLPAVPYFQLLCLYGLTRPFIQISYNIYKLYRQGRMLVMIDSARHALFLISIFITIRYGISALLIGQFVVMFIMSFVNMYFSGKLINYTVRSQITHAFPYYALSVVSGAVPWLLPYMKTDILTLIVYIPVFVLIYLVGAFVFKLNVLTELKPIVERYKK